MFTGKRDAKDGSEKETLKLGSTEKKERKEREGVFIGGKEGKDEI